MRLFLLRFLALAAALGWGSARAFDWDYSAVRFELSQEAVTSATAYRAWAAAPRRSLAEMAAAVAPSGRVKLARTSSVREGGVEKTTFDFVLEGFTDAPLPYSVVQWRPAKARAALPVVAFDGHGDCGGECSGAAPKRMFAQGGFAGDLVKRGYTVLGFPTAIHKPFERQAKTVDYPVLWAALAHRVMQKHPFAVLPQGATWRSAAPSAG